jgi:hypothetical protein
VAQRAELTTYTPKKLVFEFIGDSLTAGGVRSPFSSPIRVWI